MTRPMTRIAVSRAAPFIHAGKVNKAGDQHETLCGLDIAGMEMFLSKIEYLEVKEGKPWYYLRQERCGVCWFKYIYGAS